MFNYTHIVKSRIKHIYLRFNLSGELIVTSPPCSKVSIDTLLDKKSKWILDAQAKIAQKTKLLNEIPTSIIYLGKFYPLCVITDTDKNILDFNPQTGLALGHPWDIVKLENFYLQQAKNLLPLEVEKWAEKMGLYPNKIAFRKTKRQWGSCSKDNNISLSTMLMKLPEHLRDYIIVHELAHIRHKHHQKSFWELVGNYIPKYKTYKKELKNYT